MVVDTFILKNCEVTSPSVGTIRVSCDSSHQIQISTVCASQCDKFGGGSSNGYSPLTETGFDPGKVYTVYIDLFDGNQVMSNNERITRTVTVISTTASKIVCSMQPVVCCYSIRGLSCNAKINNQVIMVCNMYVRMSILIQTYAWLVEITFPKNMCFVSSHEGMNNYAVG